MNFNYVKLDDSRLEQVIGGACVSNKMHDRLRPFLAMQQITAVMPEYDDRPVTPDPESRSGKNQPGQNPEFDHFS